MLEYCVLARQHFDPLVDLLVEVIELTDFHPGDVIEAALAVEIAADTVGHFVLLPLDLSQVRQELFPQRRDVFGCVLGKSTAKTCNQQEVSMFEARFSHFDAFLLIHDSTPGTKKGVRLGV
ncbi:hypothetical protein D3C78_1467890 [compost metagenome]